MCFYEPLLVDAVNHSLKDLETFLNSVINLTIDDLKSKKDIDSEFMNEKSIENRYLLDYYHGLLDEIDVAINNKFEEYWDLDTDFLIQIQDKISEYKLDLAKKVYGK